MKGKLIVIEGTDSTGKQTQTKLLIERLKNEGKEVCEADFPQYYTGFFGKLIARYLRGEFGDIVEISPYFSSLLYAMDRKESSEMIKEWLDSGKTVVCNRYSLSNKAYMGARIEDETKREEFLTWLDDLEFRFNGIPRPDLSIVLYVPTEIAREWIRHKQKREYLEGKRKDIHEKNKDYLKKVEKAYIDLAKKDKNAKIIDCVENGKIDSIERISDKIWDTVKGSNL